MTQRHQRVAIGAVALCFSALIAAACGDDKPTDQNVGEAGSAGSSNNAGSAGDGGGGTDGGTGGANAAGSAGSSGSAGTNNGGSAGSGVTAGNPDDVVHALCDWEFRCCDAGERAFRLSPFATDADTCASRLIFQMRQSNATANPYLTGSASPAGLLGTLGYVVNLSRVEVSAEGVQACKEQLDARGCATEPDLDARCTGPGAADPCALTNLFKPTLQIGAECTEGLAEGGIYNDVECVVGSTCLPAGDLDNPNPNVATCVKRGLEGEPCTLDNDCDFNFFCSASGSCTEKGDADEVCSFDKPSEPEPGKENVQCKAGLSCNPLTFHCVPSCTLGSTCAIGGDNDLGCPAESGCAPVEVNEDTTAFRVCTALGNSATALCNSDEDCVATRYCDGTVCQPDKNSTTPCTANKQCAAGLHCDIGNTDTCVSNLLATNTCTNSDQCGPTSAGCLNQGTNGLACRANKLPNADECGDDVACASGRCEFATNVATVKTCVAGAALNADCDTILDGADGGDAQRCRPGLLCFGASGTPAGGNCVQQASPGTNCENPDEDPDADMCANGSDCLTQWDLHICSDTAVQPTNGGTGVTCDGN